MMSRFLFITVWLLLWCQGFCSLQHDYFYDVKVSVHYSMVTFMMSRYLLITVCSVLWCQGFCSLQHGYFYDVKVSVHYSMVTFMKSRFLFITVWLPLEEMEQRPRSCQVSLRRHRTGTTWTYDRDSHRRVRRCLSESFPQVGLFQCYYGWPTHHYECIRHSPITLQSCRLVHVLQNSLVWNYCLYWMNLMVPWTNNAFILYLLYWTLDVLNIFLCSHEVSIHQE